MILVPFIQSEIGIPNTFGPHSRPIREKKMGYSRYSEVWSVGGPALARQVCVFLCHLGPSFVAEIRNALLVVDCCRSTLRSSRSLPREIGARLKYERLKSIKLCLVILSIHCLSLFFEKGDTGRIKFSFQKPSTSLLCSIASSNSLSSISQTSTWLFKQPSIAQMSRYFS